MTVVVVTTFPGAQVEKFQEAFDRHAATMKAIAADARQKGGLHHLFAVDENGGVMAVDEWGSLEEFERFFGAQEDIRKVIAEVGITGPPSSVSYRILDTSDRF